MKLFCDDISIDPDPWWNDPYQYGACVRCLTPKPGPDLDELCGCCKIAIDRILKEHETS